MFLKIILERRADAYEHIMGYIQAFAKNDELNDVYRLSSNVSLNGLGSVLVNNRTIIYGDRGFVHHPRYYLFRYDDPNRGILSLVNELDQVLAGKGIYYEPYATQIFAHPIVRNGYGLSNDNWTLAYQSGPYYTYQRKEPADPDYRRGGDSIFHQMSFGKKDSVTEESLQLKRHKRRSAGKDIFTGYEYRKERTRLGSYYYSYDTEKFVLTIMDGSAVRKKYRVALISNEVMLLELLD
jgi:hypothetical protein